MKPKRALALAALVGLLVAATVTRPTATDYGECGYLWTAGEPGGQYAIGWSWVEAYGGGACGYDMAGAFVEVWAPGGGYDDDYAEGWGFAFAEAAAPLPAGATGYADVHGLGALEIDIEGSYNLEYYEDSFSYPVSSEPPGGGEGNQCTAFGSVFIDHNQNGVFDGGDDGFAGTTVYLADSADTYVIDVNATGPEGGYQFTGLAEGSYRVKHPVPGGYFPTTDTSVSFSACSFSFNFGIAQQSIPPPTISFSPDSAVTANYGSADVIITASVSPAGAGWEQQLSWVGDGEPTGNPMQRRFSTSALGTFRGTAVIPGVTEAYGPYVHVVPTVILNPTYVPVDWHPSDYIAFSAQVQPSSWEGPIEWTGPPSAWPNPENDRIFYVYRDPPGVHTITARAGGGEAAQAQVEVRPPVLRIVLDEDGNFNHLSPSDDSTTFLPGSTPGGPASGIGALSRPISEVAGPDGHVARLIAFFVNASDPQQWVAPPQGAQVTIRLEDTSRWKGYAMNAAWGDARDSEHDCQLSAIGSNGVPQPERAQMLNVDFGQQYAAVALRIRDYGGRTTVTAESNATQATPLRLPRDIANNNWLPDVGWKALFTPPGSSTVQVVVSDDIADPWTDNDDGVVPAAAAPGGPPAGVNTLGDGLTRFQEYRGFVVNGIHIRTSPNHKDLFVSSTVSRQSLSLDEGLRFAKASLFEHGIRLHRIRDQDEPGNAESLGPLLNFSNSWGDNQDPADFVGQGYVHFDQSRLRVEGVALLPNDQLGLTSLGNSCSLSMGYTPNGTPLIRVAIQQHVTAGGMSLTTAQIDNEIRRTTAHEIGHGIHVKHKNSPNPPGCDDGAPTSGLSVMTDEWGFGVGAGDSQSKYNDADVKQMRVHERP